MLLLDVRDGMWASTGEPARARRCGPGDRSRCLPRPAPTAGIGRRGGKRGERGGRKRTGGLKIKSSFVVLFSPLILLFPPFVLLLPCPRYTSPSFPTPLPPSRYMMCQSAIYQHAKYCLLRDLVLCNTTNAHGICTCTILICGSLWPLAIPTI